MILHTIPILLSSQGGIWGWCRLGHFFTFDSAACLFALVKLAFKKLEK